MKELNPRLSRCPMCHRKGMRRRILDVVLDGGKRVAHGIEVDVCPSCGEHLFDPEAMRKMETACPVRSRPRGRTAVQVLASGRKCR